MTLYAPRTMMGNQVYNRNGIVIEQFNMGRKGVIKINTQGIGKRMYMYIVDGKTTYHLYSTRHKAIKAAQAC